MNRFSLVNLLCLSAISMCFYGCSSSKCRKFYSHEYQVEVESYIDDLKMLDMVAKGWAFKWAPQQFIEEVGTNCCVNTMADPDSRNVLKLANVTADKSINNTLPDFEKMDRILCWTRPIIVKGYVNERSEVTKIVGVCWAHDDDQPEVFFLEFTPNF